MNIRDLANELKLSVATVSKALRDSHEISQQTKQKVLEAAARLNYTPNPYASSLRKKKSKTIAVVLPEVADNFFSLAINGIQSVAESKGYHVLIYLSHEKYSNEKTIMDECSTGRADGVLMSISGETATADHIQKLREENIPVVFFDREFEDYDTAKVITNDFECGQLSSSLLLSRGCRNPVFLSVSSSLSICQKRADGFIAGLKENGMDTDEHNPVIFCSGKEEEIYDQIVKLVTQEDRPDGIVASVERVAMQVYMACHEYGIKIPEQIKVVAFSTLETAPILSPPLTTIKQPAFDIGKTAAEILFKAIEKKNYDIAAEKIILPSVLVERASTLDKA